jgi:hypothetical protein
LGQREDRIAVARELIENQEYNKAEELLAEIAQEEPEKFDEVETLLRQIREIRRKFNDRYEELIAVLAEENDPEKALAIIEELESIDRTPNQATLRSIAQAKRSALFYANLNRFREIMEEGLALIRAELYWEAVTVYLSGFDLQKSQFHDAGYGNIITGQVDGAVAEVRDAIDEFAAMEEGFHATVTSIRQSLEVSELEEVGQAVDRAVELFRRLAKVRQTSYEAAVLFDRQNERVQEVREDGKEDFYLGYLNRLINGNKRTTYPEGIVGAMDVLWQRTFEDLAAPLTLRGETAFQEARAQLAAGETQQALTFFDRAHSSFTALLDLVAVWEARLYLDESLALQPDANAVLAVFVPRFVQAQSKALGAQLYRELLPLLAQAEELPVDLDSELPELREARSRVARLNETIGEVLGGWHQSTAKYERLSQSRFPVQEVVAFVSSVDDDFVDAAARLRSQEIRIARAVVQQEYAPLDAEYAAAEERLEEAQVLITGVQPDEEVEEATAATVAARYPDQALDALEAGRDLFAALREEVVAFLDVRGQEPDYIRQDQEVRGYVTRAETLLADTEDGIVLVDALVEEANQQILLAQRYRNEGFLRVDQAEQALNQGDFDAAREGVDSASESFVTALTYQEDQDFRRRTDELLASLQERILAAERRVVIAEVRQLINRGKRLYLQTQFEEAELVFLQAQNRYTRVFQEEDEEINYWLGFIRVALSLRTGRTLEEREPLYPEMSQLLSLARQDYQAGRRLLREGNRRDAIEHFDRAEAKLLSVTVAFPLNQEANVLSLRIQQLKDPEAFSDRFRQLYQDARSKIRTQPQEAYVTFQDLYELNPRYPGLTASINEVEIVLGIKAPPPDPADLAQSEELYEQAFEIVRSNVRANFPIALEQLNQAITLNPENQKAVELKDRILLDAGGTATIVLSSRAEQQYRLAEEKYIDAKYFEALAIIQQLLQDERNQRYPKILELKRRIESRTGG